MPGENYYVVSVKINKITIDYQIYKKLLSFSKKDKKFLLIKGFFGSVSLKIPKGIFININENNIILYFSNHTRNTISFINILKSFYSLIIFSCHGLVFNHIVDMNIKGIGFKFELKKNRILVYSGNSLPTLFDIPTNLQILDNSSSNNYSVLSSDYAFLNNFVNKIRNTAIPNKYKEIGIFLEKKL